jgi:hypothetical protein
MRHVRQCLLTGFDACKHGGVMQWHERDQPPDFFDHIPVYYYGAAIEGSAVAYSMRHGANFREALYRSALNPGDCVKNEAKGGEMVRDLNIYKVFLSAAGAGMLPAFHADSRYGAAHERSLGVEIEKLVFERRAAAVNDQNFHAQSS